MKLSALAGQYAVYKQSVGMRFHTEGRTLRSFCRAMGEVSVAEIAPDRVYAYHKNNQWLNTHRLKAGGFGLRLKAV